MAAFAPRAVVDSKLRSGGSLFQATGSRGRWASPGAPLRHLLGISRRILLPNLSDGAATKAEQYRALGKTPAGRLNDLGRRPFRTGEGPKRKFRGADLGRLANFGMRQRPDLNLQFAGGAKGLFLRSGSPQNVYLLPQRQNFSLERCPRPKQICDHPDNEPDKISHPVTASPDSRSTASQIEFATGTGGHP
jgi:hypothetical protein